MEGDKEFVKEGSSRFSHLVFEEIPQEMPSSETVVTPAPASRETRTTLVEFYRSKNALTHDDRFLVFAYWLAENDGLVEFKADDLAALYSRISEPRPTNPAQHMVSNVKRAFFDRLEDELHRLTQLGAKHVEEL